MLRSVLALALGATLLQASAATRIAAASELDGIMQICSGNKICSWFKTKAEPPKGWEADEEWTNRYEAVVMFKGGDQSKTAPMMYVRTHLAEKTIEIGDYIKGAQEGWLDKVKDSKITALPDVAREGKPTFKVFLYENPSVPDQAFELTAFTKDTDPSHDNATYFQQVVLVAPDKEVLESSRAAFEELLQRL